VALSLSYFLGEFYHYLSSSVHSSSLLKRFKVSNARLLCLDRQLSSFSSYRTENTVYNTNTKYVNVRRFHACNFCTILTKREFHRQVLEKKIVSVKFHENSPGGAELFHVAGRTDTTKSIAAFHTSVANTSRMTLTL